MVEGRYAVSGNPFRPECRGFPLWHAEQLDSMRGIRRALCTCDPLSAAPFAGTGAWTRIDVVDTGAHDSDSAPSYARREPSQSRSEARCVRLARSSCAVASSSQAAQGYRANAGRDTRGGLLLRTFSSVITCQAGQPALKSSIFLAAQEK
jgi:hypothetical protein